MKTQNRQVHQQEPPFFMCEFFRNPWVLLSMPSGILETCLQQEKTMTFITVSQILENFEQLKEQDFLASENADVYFSNSTN